MELSNVKFVGIWLRKSRGDEETALEKHRAQLTEMADRYNWTYEVYEEMGTSQDIEWRPQMQRFLVAVESGIYDAVLCMDLDRFSRGELKDIARYREAFEKSNTPIITPTSVYDWSKDETSFLADVQGVFARQEYRMIVKRLRQGKHIGAKLGRWTNGPAPLPYKYDRLTRQLVVDPESLEVYNLIKKRVLDNVALYHVAQELNRLGIPSPKGRTWAATTLHRLITSEVHLGRIVQQKTKGSFHRNRKTYPFSRRPREEWLVAEGTHQPVKTMEEHLRILEIMERRRLFPTKSRKGTYALSGLVRCGLCGGSMQFLTKANSKVSVKTCQHSDPYGKSCTNRGGLVEYVYTELNNFINQWEQQLLESTPHGRPENHSLQSQLEARLAELRDLEEGVERIHDLYVMKRLTKPELEARLAKHDGLIRTKRDEIAQLQELVAASGLSDEERLQRIAAFKHAWSQADFDPAEMNRLLRQLIDRIVWTRIGDDITIQVVPI